MKCRRAFDADLPSLLEGQGDDPEFLSHYAACPDCAAEVGAWRELHGLLRVGVTTNGEHPGADELVALIDRPDSLGVGERAALERHLAACRPCGDEARLLRTIDVATTVAAAAPSTVTSPPAVPPVIDPEPEAEPPRVAAPVVAPLAAAEAAPAPAPTSTTAPAVAARRSGLSRFVWHPAVAYALVAVLLVPLVYDQLGRLMPPREETALVIRRAAPEAPPAEAPLGADVPSVEDVRAAAEVQAPSAAIESEAAAPPPPAAGMVAKMAEPRADALAARREQMDALSDSPVPQLPRQAPPAARLAGSAAPAGARSLDAEAVSRPVIDVEPGAFPAVPFAVAKQGALLRIETPPGVDEGVVDVRVRRRTGGRELFERLTARADAIELEIPADWLVSGEYEVTVEAADGRRRARRGEADAAPRGRLRFAVGPAETDDNGVAAPGAPR